jgi:hypothetical protein
MIKQRADDHGQFSCTTVKYRVVRRGSLNKQRPTIFQWACRFTRMRFDNLKAMALKMMLLGDVMSCRVFDIVKRRQWCCVIQNRIRICWIYSLPYIIRITQTTVLSLLASTSRCLVAASTVNVHLTSFPKQQLTTTRLQFSPLPYIIFLLGLF